MKLNTARIAFCASLLIGTGLGSVIATAQSADKEAQFSALLQQIADTKLVIAQKQAYLDTQQSQIDNLKVQIETIPAIKESIRPMVTQMTAEIEKEIIKDLPFLAQERFARLDSLKDDLADVEIGESAIFRKAITIYDIETNYGNSVGSYTGDNPVTPGTRLAACKEDLSSTACSLTDELAKSIVTFDTFKVTAKDGGLAEINSVGSGGFAVLLTDALEAAGITVDESVLERLAKQGDLNDGNYVHFGRLALLYLEVDSSQGFRYVKDSDSWVELSQGEIIGVRKSVRIARGESAAGVVTAPILIDPAP